MDAPLNLKLSHFRLMAALSDKGRLGLAAREIGVTQPAASRLLAEAEQIVGSKLAVRHARGMDLTLTGRALARRSHNILVEMADMSEELRSLGRGYGGVARIGAVTGAALGYVVPALRQLRAAASKVELQLDVAPSEQLLRGLESGRLDIMLGRLPPDADPADFILHRARPERVELLVRDAHPLSGRASIGLEELSEFDWVLTPRAIPIRGAVESAFQAAGVPLPHCSITTSSLLAVIALLDRSTAIAPVAGEVATLLTKVAPTGLRRLPLREEITVSPYSVITMRERRLTPLAARLRNLVVEELRSPDTGG
ncbi:LysR substrate-binding domain-containing protein [Oceanomicrobium pacificus]|uniref:LysR family transcriptional regulator n=1 Tax=Oceanomicrobium pacificus TaxID=2692916 RepID=A0A6B0U0D3_9RHOB|nr:LysR substrate-binding domain-containing protein [Oceanomicrobium pacificus]MXU66684.1 LysR family transcriptional regulator [Oceanomicrobium pacificus]